MGHSPLSWAVGDDLPFGPARSGLFAAAVAPDDAVPHPAWQAARQGVLAALQPGAVVLLLGGPGSGKTLFLHALHAALTEAGRGAALVRPGHTEAGGAGIVLVDDAEAMPDAALRGLVSSGRCVLLAGGAGLRGRAGLAASATVELAPLTPSMVGGFLAWQLDAAGQRAGLFTAEAVAALGRHSGGVPRLLQELAGLSAFVARLEDAPAVLPSHVAQAAVVRSGTVLEAEVPEPPRDVRAAAPFPAAVPPISLRSAAAPAVPPRHSAPPALHLSVPVAFAILCCAAGVLVVNSVVHPVHDGTRADAAVPRFAAANRNEAAGWFPAVPAEAAASEPSVPVAAGELAPAAPVAMASVPPQPAPFAAAPPALAEAAPAAAAEAATVPAAGVVAAVNAEAATARDAAPAAWLVGLPATVAPRVEVFAGRDPAAERRAAVLVRTLREGAIAASLAPPLPGPARAEAGVSFFFAEDAGAAADIARQAGLPGRAQLLRPRGPQPEPGTIQVVIPAAPARTSRN